MSRRALWALFLTATVTLALFPVPAGAGNLKRDLEDVVERIQELSSQIDDVTAERSDLAARIRAAGSRLDRLLLDLEANESAVATLEAETAVHDRRLGSVRAALAVSYTELFDTRTEIAARRGEAVELARGAYVRGRSDIAALTFAAEHLTDMSVGLAYLDRAAAHNGGGLASLLALHDAEEAQQVRIRGEEVAVAEEVARAELLRADLEAVHAALESDRSALDATVAGLELLLSELDDELEEFEGEIAALEGEQRRIKRKIASEQAKRTATPMISAAGFVRPVPGAITSGFGPRHHPVLGYSRMHTGVDMSAGRGQPIKAARPGKVILAGTWGGYGRTVVIDHGGGLSTLYAHMSSLRVSKGDTVNAGEVVGKAGSTGLATGAHLHFEVRVGGDPVDPAAYLRG